MKVLTSYSYAEVSTCHITKDDSRKLSEDFEDEANEGFIVYQYPEGFFIYVADCHDDEEQLKEWSKRYSPQLVSLAKLASEEGNVFLRLDADGFEVDGLPKFDW